MTEQSQNISALMPDGVGALFYQETASTNTLAAKAASMGEAGPTWYIAAKQTDGRGRRGREWDSQPGNLFASLLWRPDIPMSSMSALPFLASLAVVDTLERLGCLDVQVKWPNDVLIGGKKASGILIESSASGAKKPDYVTIGIGINLEHFPKGTVFGAISVKESTGTAPNVIDAAVLLAECLDGRISAWDVGDFKPVQQAWTSRAWGLGERRTFTTHDESFEATALELSDDGGLRLLLGNGQEKNLYAGDVFPVSVAQTSHDI